MDVPMRTNIASNPLKFTNLNNSAKKSNCGYTTYIRARQTAIGEHQ